MGKRARLRLRSRAAAAPQPSSVKATIDKRDTGIRYRNYLLRQWALGFKTSKELCTEAFLSSKAGAREVNDLGICPSALGRNHSRHVRDTLGLKELRGKFYFVKVPVYDKRTAARTHRWIPVRLPHEIVMDIRSRDPRSVDIKKQDPDEVMVPTFTEHAVVVEKGIANTVPVGLYSDATPVYKTGSVLA
eukprot:4109602-Pyramimonas_sp.AAC.1